MTSAAGHAQVKLIEGSGTFTVLIVWAKFKKKEENLANNIQSIEILMMIQVTTIFSIKHIDSLRREEGQCIVNLAMISAWWWQRFWLNVSFFLSFMWWLICSVEGLTSDITSADVTYQGQKFDMTFAMRGGTVGILNSPLHVWWFLFVFPTIAKSLCLSFPPFILCSFFRFGVCLGLELYFHSFYQLLWASTGTGFILHCVPLSITPPPLSLSLSLALPNLYLTIPVWSFSLPTLVEFSPLQGVHCQSFTHSYFSVSLVSHSLWGFCYLQRAKSYLHLPPWSCASPSHC